MIPRAPYPHPEILPPERAPSIQRLACARRSACLEDADARGWESFTCYYCAGFVPISAEQAEIDAKRLSALGHAIAGAALDAKVLREDRREIVRVNRKRREMRLRQRRSMRAQ